MNDPELVKVELLLRFDQNIFPQLRNKFTQTIYLPAGHIPRVGDTMRLPKNEGGEKLGIHSLQFFTIKKVQINYTNIKDDEYSLISYKLELGVEPGQNQF